MQHLKVDWMSRSQQPHEEPLPAPLTHSLSPGSAGSDGAPLWSKTGRTSVSMLLLSSETCVSSLFLERNFRERERLQHTEISCWVFWCSRPQQPTQQAYHSVHPQTSQGDIHTNTGRKHWTSREKEMKNASTGETEKVSGWNQVRNIG